VGHRILLTLITSGVLSHVVASGHVCVVFAYRVHTDSGKVWKVLEFNVEIFKALKSLENDHRCGKVWKNLLKTVMLTWKIQMPVTLLITDAFVNFLAIHDTKHLKLRVQNLSSIRYLE